MLVSLSTALACGVGSKADDAIGTSSTSSSSATSAESSTTIADTPECDGLILPGDPEDVAATPRPDRDAEILALELASERFVARTVDYDVVASDLAAIRTLAPELSDVHAECRVPDGYDFWLFMDYEIVDAVFYFMYHAWDCHNVYYGIDYRPFGEGGDVQRFDGVAFRMIVRGVYSPAFPMLYAQLPGFETASIEPYWDPTFGEPCERSGDAITLDATLDGDGLLDERTYRFESTELGARTFRVTPDAGPIELG